MTRDPAPRRPRRLVPILVVIAVAVLVGAFILQSQLGGVPAPSEAGLAKGTASVPGGSAPSSIPSGTRQGVRHVWVIVMENRSADQVIGSSQAPFLNGLAQRYGVATDYRGVAHPSEPNYLALISGSTQGVSDDGVHDISAPTVLGQLEAAGRTWGVYAEHVPGGCYRGATAKGGPDGAGTYARKHEPAISFTSVSSNPDRCANITDFSHFRPGETDFSLIIPDMCHDMHDCSVSEGDRWLSSFVPQITSSAAFMDGGLLVVTFDEAEGGAQRVPFVFAGPDVAPGTRIARQANHYDLLRTVQAAFGLPCLADSCQAAPMAALLQRGGG